MALGRQGDRQGDLVVTWREMPRSPGHVFYDRLQGVLIEADFDAFAEATCKPYYAAKMGAPSIPPGRYFRMHMVGYFEGINSERGIEWRCADSLSLREFLRLRTTERVPDHSWLSKTRSRLPAEALQRQQLAEVGREDELVQVALDQDDDRVIAKALLEVLGRAVGGRVVVDELIVAGVGLQLDRADDREHRDQHRRDDDRDRLLDAPARDPCEAIPH